MREIHYRLYCLQLDLLTRQCHLQQHGAEILKERRRLGDLMLCQRLNPLE